MMRTILCGAPAAILWLATLSTFASELPVDQQAKPEWCESVSEWKGFVRCNFRVAEKSAYVVRPKTALAGNPWVWRARFPGYHAEMDVALVKLGFHIGYVDVAGLFGGPQAMKIGDAFYDLVTSKAGLAAKPVLEGVSRGGLLVYRWAARHPDRVAGIYCDTPVCDFKSWPGGQGTGIGAKAAWKQCLQAYQLNEAAAAKFAGNPIDLAEKIAAAKIPLLHIVAENDRVVPPKENTYLLRDRLRRLGHQMEVISVAKGTAKSNGHHFDHPQPPRVVKFVLTCCQVKLANDTPQVKGGQLVKEAKRILFVGDSITYAGDYVTYFDAWLWATGQDKVVINGGLPSETVSGLSEQGHAGGRFPRPDLHERLVRLLDATKPDLVFACYGMNCGIYQPFDAKRFAAYQRGITSLRQQVTARGAKLVLVTPPFYDDQTRRRKFSYNQVLDRYSGWLRDQQSSGWLVVDLHTAMAAAVARQRQQDKKFTFQRDGVHPNAAGHWVMAQPLIRWCGEPSKAAAESPEQFLKALGRDPAALKLIRQRMALLRDAYLTASGHKRPGIRAGLPLPQAKEKAQAFTTELVRLREPKQAP